MTELVIGRTLLRILQDFIGFIDFLELLLCSFRIVGVAIRMIFEGQFMEGLLYFLLRGIAVYTEHLVVIAFLAHFAPS